jgi:DNA invertase Pin-like site-specific DNA recombinase
MTQLDNAPVEPTPSTINRIGLYDQTIALLRAVWEAYAAGLPLDISGWRLGAAYVRESNARSMTRDSPVVQLSYTLNQFARREIWVPWEAVFFDNASGTSIAAREAFQRLLAEALAGRYSIIGAYLSDRLFRNAKEAQEVKLEFLLRGIELDYLGKLEGDARSPLMWQSERTQELMDEYLARKTSEQVGRAFEHLSQNGRPLGRLPEGFRIGERGPSYMGEPGRILNYVRNEPLASIIVEGKERYLAGAPYAKLVAWAQTTELQGVTEGGARMTWQWWAATLLNPKYAGYQMPTRYAGFKPGVESPKRPRRKNLVTELVPCVLPALYPLSDWESIVELSRQRQKGAKVGPKYRVSLLSSIAYDERCGHRIAIHSWRRGHLEMMCNKTTDGRHARPLRADVAERQLDELIGGMRFDNPELLAGIETELTAMAERPDRSEQTEANPEVSRLQAALAALGDTATPEISGPLTARLRALRTEQKERQTDRLVDVRRYRASVSDLRDWGDIWGLADVRRKNELLRLAGFRVRLGRPLDQTGVPAEILSIAVDDPIFGLALASALDRDVVHGSAPGEPRTVSPLVTLESGLNDVLVRARLGREQGARAA